MYRGTIRRGITALSLVTFLAVAGAQPAAAASDAGFLGRLAGLWTAVAGGESDTLWNRLTVWLEGKPGNKAPRATAKRGFGLDPNGRVTPVDDQPTDPDGSASGVASTNG
jgi:hypothetical protein